MMVSKYILVVFSLLLVKLMVSDAFRTDQCDHANLTISVRKLQTCLDDVSGDDDICSPFLEANECVTNNLKECFIEDDLQRIAKEKLGGIRVASTKLILNPALQTAHLGFVLSEAEVDSLFSTCPNIPDKNFSENVKFKHFFVLEAGVKTDDNCTEDEITEVNGLGECEKSELEKFKAQITRRLRSARGSVQSTICSVLDGTVGKCLRKPLPACFSERENIFLKNKMSENIQNVFKVVEEDLIGEKLGKLSFSDCSVFSDSRTIFPTSSMLIVMLALTSFFVIN